MILYMLNVLVLNTLYHTRDLKNASFIEYHTLGKIQYNRQLELQGKVHVIEGLIIF